jgi:hypothetical protein
LEAITKETDKRTGINQMKNIIFIRNRVQVYLHVFRLRNTREIELKYKKLVKKQEEDDTDKVEEKPIIINA